MNACTEKWGIRQNFFLDGTDKIVPGGVCTEYIVHYVLPF